ncbi:AAA family ATPase [Nannocystis sp. RBIL2]|uniref:AAA family ATPase n=1 Tax=Nannocystis sp. RBIL2 TaxID=2996788 RepID=UPI0022703D19|nr:AAA family ATPase [Nannocystis sp. RBIL2]MCY1064617.1 AAA family ATPase [Nannocystis sp. RBIL2]
MSGSPYTIVETLHEVHGTLRYRGVRTHDHCPVVLEVADPRHDHGEAAARLRQEYETTQALHSPAIVRPLALDTFEGMPALVLADGGGEPLEHLLGGPMPADEFLPLAVKLAAAVAEVHEAGIIHKNLTPQNIFVGPTPDEVVLLGFGFASRLPREPVTAPHWLAGSLPYMAPEQTGRMNRAVDRRSDLYSLGVVFYQLLTGQLPFRAGDLLEWVHCHVARSPRAPVELVPAVPAAVSAVVLKLLAKMAEDRYQTARGLQHDLERCWAAWRAEGRIEPFVLGAHDLPDRLEIPQRLHGRAAELDALRAAFTRVMERGTPALLLVSGGTGVGKSALVQELQRPAVHERGCFVAGKCEQYRRDVPYAGFAQACTALVEQLLTQGEEHLAIWRERLRQALGPSARLVFDVVPRLELVVGPQPPPPPLPPAQALHRFHLAFRRFVAVFARREHPLALFLDDLQWLDAAGLALLADLVTHAQTGCLLLLGAYRDNEVTTAHPLMRTLADIRSTGAVVHDIHLGPLAVDDLTAVTADALHCSRDHAAPLAALVHARTGGVPFFAVQLLAELADDGLLRFDRAGQTWGWDAAQIGARGFTNDVVDLMVGKLRRLSGPTLAAVKLAACIGDRIDREVLALALGRPPPEVHAALWDAVRAGLLLHDDGAYAFVHDRVREAAYSLIPAQDRPATHLRIGRSLQAHTPAEALPGRLFAMVDQLDRGLALVTDSRERDALCALNVAAGLKAKAASAHAAALRYLSEATSLLPADAWDRRHADTFTLHLERAECEHLVGDLAASEQRIELLLARARTNLDRARAYRLRMRMHQLSGRYADAVTALLAALRLFDVDVPATEAELRTATEAELREVAGNLRGRAIADLVDAPPVRDPDMAMVLGLLGDGLSAAFIARPELYPLLTAKAVNLSLRHGNAAESCIAYSYFASLRAADFGDVGSAFEFSEMSLRLNAKLDDRKVRGRLLFIHVNFIAHRRKHFATSIPMLEQACADCLECGDLLYAGFAAYSRLMTTFQTGVPLAEVLRLSQTYAVFAEELRHEGIQRLIHLVQRVVLRLRGPAPSPASREDDDFDARALATFDRMGFGPGAAYVHITEMIGAFMFGRHAEAIAASERAAPTLRTVTATPLIPEFHFFRALTLATADPEVSSASARDRITAVADDLRTLQHFADSCPENYSSPHALVAAELARLEGRDFDAVRLYEQAIRAAGDNCFVQYEALAHELAAQFYRARDLERLAAEHLRAARAAYVRWGADAKVRQLDERYSFLKTLRRAEPLSPASAVTVGAEQLDLLAVVKASQTISRELVVEQLVRTLLAVVLEQSGAQAAYLLFARGDALSLAARATVDEHGVDATLLPAQPLGPASTQVPAAIVRYALRTREPVRLDDAAASPVFAADPYVAARKPRSVLCLPLVRQHQVVALLYLENDLATGVFTPERLGALELLAAQAAISLDNARLLQRERATRAATEAAERRAAFLAEAGALLSESLDWEQTMTRIGRLSVRMLADWCVIDVISETGEIRRIAGAHADAAKEPALLELQARYPPRIDSVHPAAYVLRTGRPLLLSELSDALIRSLTIDARHARLLAVLGTRTAVSVPLAARGQTLGVLTLGSAAVGRRYGATDLALAEELARRAALSLDNARLYREAQAAIRLREEFVMVASHELNTPVAAMELAIQKLLRDKRVTAWPEDVRRMLGVVERQGWQLTHLVAQMLDVARIHAGQMLLVLADVDLAAVVRAVAERLAERFERARCPLSLQAVTSVVGRWDRGRLEQALTCLLDNALKFGAGKPIEVEVARRGANGRLVVRDHGIGLAPDQLPRIFRRFEHAASPLQYGGLGLGLFIVREIVSALGGQVDVESAVGVGSTFAVELPRAGPRQPRP